jgi:hypothetical protein
MTSSGIESTFRVLARCFSKLRHRVPLWLRTYLLASWGRVFLENLTGLQLVKKFAAFYRIRSFITHSQGPTTCLYPEPAQSSQYPTSHFLKIHLNIIFPSTPGSPQWYLSLRFPHQNSVKASPLPHPRYMPRPSHSSRFYHPHNGGWEVLTTYIIQNG